MDNLNADLNLTNDNYLNLIAYDEETFKRIFPKSTKEDYIKTQFSIDYPYEAIKHAEIKLNKNLDGSRFVVIDDDFLNFCNNKSLELNANSINEYIDLISDHKAKELWLKSEKDYDFVLSSIPIIIQNIYEEDTFSRYYNFSYELLEKAKLHLGSSLNIPAENIMIYEMALSKDDALVNSDLIKKSFLDKINNNNEHNLKLVKSIFKGYSKDSFSIKYLLCGIKIDRSFKMTKNQTIEDSNVDIGKLLVNDEMAILSEILSDKKDKAIIYPAFERIININEIESSEEILKQYLPTLIVSD